MMPAVTHTVHPRLADDLKAVQARLQRSHANLRARGFLTAAEDMLAAIAFCDQCVSERDASRAEALDARKLRTKLGRLEFEIVQARKARDEAREEAKQARMPLEAAQARARKEVRDILRPYLTDGQQGMRMLAMTIKAALDAEWGKE